MWSIRNLKDHDVSYATAILRQVIKTIVSKGFFILYGRTGGTVYNSIDNWNNNAQCLLVDAHGDRPITKAAGSAAGSADAPGLLADAYGTQPINVSWRRIVRIQNSGISIPLSLLKLLGLRRILIASFTLRVYQCLSWERH